MQQDFDAKTNIFDLLIQDLSTDKKQLIETSMDKVKLVGTEN